jgi:catechol 2,3-dioxygenase-like lactoylglutathione lyase family enzyme
MASLQRGSRYFRNVYYHTGARGAGDDSRYALEASCTSIALNSCENLLRETMANKVETQEQPAAQLLRMDNVAVVVHDLDAAIQFFAELGLVLEGRMQVQGDWVDHVVGLAGVRSEIAMMRTPDGHSRLELTKYHAPAAVTVQTKNSPANTLGLHRIMFAVEDIDGVIARLRKHGAELIGEVAQYEQMYRLCYLRGPEGIIVALAQRIG